MEVDSVLRVLDFGLLSLSPTLTSQNARDFIAVYVLVKLEKTARTDKLTRAGIKYFNRINSVMKVLSALLN